MGSINPEDDLAVVHAILDKQGMDPDLSAARRLARFIVMVNHLIEQLTDTAIGGMESVAKAPDLTNQQSLSEGVRAYKLNDGSVQPTLPFSEFDLKA